MTEYDFSPEAYERYLSTQRRIANWVDKTEQHRSQFEHAIQSNPAGGSPMRHGHTSYDSHHRSRRSPTPSPTRYSQQFGHVQQPRQLFVPAPESDSSDEYGHGPGPMPLSSPGIVYPQQPTYHPMVQPMLPQQTMMAPPTYMTSPPRKSSHRRHRSSRSHSGSYSNHSSGYYNMASPPVSPGYQYSHPSMMGGGHPGYFMMQPQHYPSNGRQIPFMYLS